MLINDVIALVEKPAVGGGGYRAVCPCCAQENKKERKLVITEKNNYIQFYCYRGHSHAEIRDALGLTSKDLFTDSLPHDKLRAFAAKRSEEETKQKIQFEEAVLKIFAAKKAKNTATQEDFARAQQAHTRLAELKTPKQKQKISKQDLIADCYKEKVSIAKSEQEKASIWRKHLAKKANALHQAIKPNKQFTRIATINKFLINKQQSAFIQAPLGAGKTSKIAKPLIEKAKIEGRPVLSITVLRSLAQQNATTLQLDVYSDNAEIIRLSRGVSATVHSTTKDTFLQLIQAIATQNGLVVIDEAAQVAQLLYDSNSILSGEQKEKFLAILQAIKFFTVQVVLLDADVTLTAAQLIKQLDIPIFSCSETEHELPEFSLYPAQKKNAPLHRQILESLSEKRKTVIFCTTRRQAEALYKLYKQSANKSILLTSQTCAQAEQIDFLKDPNGRSQEYDLIVYSPVLGSGFSVTSIEADIYGFITHDALEAQSILQLARRFRRASNNKIKITASHNVMKPTRSFVSSQQIAEDVNQACNYISCPFTAGQIAALQQKNLNSSNPYLIFKGHLINAGYKVSVFYRDDSTEQEKEQVLAAKASAKAEEIERVLKANDIDAFEAKQLEKGAGTYDAAARLQRFKIKEALAISSQEELTKEITENALFGKLLKQVKMQSYFLSYGFGVNLSITEEKVTRPAFAKHTQQQFDIVAKIINMISDEKSGVIRFTGSDAMRVSNMIRAEVKAQHKLITKPPARNKEKRLHTQWLKNFLSDLGYNLKKIRAKSWRTTSDQWIYTAEIDDIVLKYSARKAQALIAEDKNKKIMHSYAESPAKSGVAGVIEWFSSFIHSPWPSYT